MEFKELIKAKRRELGLTLEDVGNAVGVGKSTVAKWERGQIKNVRRDNLAALANVLCLSPLELLKDSDTDIVPERPVEKPETSSDNSADLKAAFFGGYSDDLSQEEIDELWADAQDYARFKAQQRINRKKNQSEE